MILTKDFKMPNSISVTEVFERLGPILPNFDDRQSGFGVLHVGRRNEELHSGSTPFQDVGNSDWLPLFYESINLLILSVGDA